MLLGQFEKKNIKCKKTKLDVLVYNNGLKRDGIQYIFNKS